jgi:rubrerythrin
MSDATDAPRASSLADLYAIAYQIEADAVERYNLLADQMEMHNNLELVVIFRDLARAEGIHSDEICRMAGDLDVPAHARKVAHWRIGESPESADLSAAHYLMTPHDALRMALAGEQRALKFFEGFLANARDAAVKRLAKELLEEETEHVQLCHRLLQRYPAPQPGQAGDPDPPVPQE